MQRCVEVTPDAPRVVDNSRPDWSLARAPKTPPRSPPPPRCRTAGTVLEKGKGRYEPGRQHSFASPPERPIFTDVEIPQCPSTPSSIQSVQPARRRLLSFVDDDDKEEAVDDIDNGSEPRGLDSPMSLVDARYAPEKQHEDEPKDEAGNEPAGRLDDGTEDMVVDITRPSEPTHSTNTLHLLDLPVEIRHQIYHEFPETHISTRPLIYGLSPFAGRKQHPLSTICRQIRHEALELYYSQNTWAIKLEFEMMYDAFLCWLSKVGIYTQHLRVLQISLSTRYLPPVCGKGYYAAEEPGLNSLGSWNVPNLAPAPTPPLPPPQSHFEGQATFEIDLSEKYAGGRVRVLRTESDAISTRCVQDFVQDMTTRLWVEKNQGGGVREGDIKGVVDMLLESLDTRWYRDRSRPVIS